LHAHGHSNTHSIYGAYTRNYLILFAGTIS